VKEEPKVDQLQQLMPESDDLSDIMGPSLTILDRFTSRNIELSDWKTTDESCDGISNEIIAPVFPPAEDDKSRSRSSANSGSSLAVHELLTSRHVGLSGQQTATDESGRGSQASSHTGVVSVTVREPDPIPQPLEFSDQPITDQSDAVKTGVVSIVQQPESSASGSSLAVHELLTSRNIGLSGPQTDESGRASTTASSVAVKERLSSRNVAFAGSGPTTDESGSALNVRELLTGRNIDISSESDARPATATSTGVVSWNGPVPQAVEPSDSDEFGVPIREHLTSRNIELSEGMWNYDTSDTNRNIESRRDESASEDGLQVQQHLIFTGIDIYGSSCFDESTDGYIPEDVARKPTTLPIELKRPPPIEIPKSGIQAIPIELPKSGIQPIPIELPKQKPVTLPIELPKRPVAEPETKPGDKPARGLANAVKGGEGPTLKADPVKGAVETVRDEGPTLNRADLVKLPPKEKPAEPAKTAALKTDPVKGAAALDGLKEAPPIKADLVKDTVKVTPQSEKPAAAKPAPLKADLLKGALAGDQQKGKPALDGLKDAPIKVDLVKGALQGKV
jgi:hypothetical protein